MASDEKKDHESNSFKYIQLTARQIEQLPPHEQLEAALEFRRLLQIIIDILYTPNISLTVRAVACDLVYTQAEQRAHEGMPDDVDEQTTYVVKRISKRLGLSTSTVRKAYEQLAKMGAIHIDQIQFPPYHQPPPPPLANPETESTD
jgi:DNA-binding MarR family transcriptional regulator